MVDGWLLLEMVEMIAGGDGGAMVLRKKLGFKVYGCSLGS